MGFDLAIAKLNNRLFFSGKRSGVQLRGSLQRGLSVYVKRHFLELADTCPLRVAALGLRHSSSMRKFWLRSLRRVFRTS
jgi:hypothetical protein